MEDSETHHRIPPPSDTTSTHDGGYLHGRFFTNNPNPSPANSISAAADVDDVPFSRMASPANSISAAADADDVNFTMMTID
jgi:hypothetical protein